MSDNPISRRKFLARSGLASGGLVLGSWAGGAAGANERVRTALIGCGGRGRYDIRGMAAAGAQVVALCDINPQRLAETAKFLQRYAPEPRVRGMRMEPSMDKLLEDRSLDAVVVATPDHWHAPASIKAVLAGKDVYVEKPHAHTVKESRLMIRAAERTGRLIQAGTQNRSGAYNLEALEYIRQGRLGPVHLVKVYNVKSGGAFRMGDPGEKPEGLNWDAWLGPAPWRPWHRQLYYGGWHHFWDYSGGDLRDDGVHQTDLALMLMGDPGLPRSVASTGGRLAHRGDDSQVPDVLSAHFDFGDFVMTVDHTDYPKYMMKTTMSIRQGDKFPFWMHNSTRIEIYGTDQMMVVGRHGGGWQATIYPWEVAVQRYGRPCDDEHYRNFLDCVKSRKEPNAAVRKAHAALCALQMANIAHRIGNTALRFDPKTQTFDKPEANRLLERTYRRGYELPRIG